MGKDNWTNIDNTISEDTFTAKVRYESHADDSYLMNDEDWKREYEASKIAAMRELYEAQQKTPSNR